MVPKVVFFGLGDGGEGRRKASKDVQVYKDTYVVGSKSFRPDIQKSRQMENAVRDIQGVSRL